MLVYNFLLQLANQIICLLSLWSPKLKRWHDGRKNLHARMLEVIKSTDRVIWFHAASLGEFEEGRPLLEKVRTLFPGYKILLTFFSPSGYEVRKNYDQADWVFYLPLDTPKNVARFLTAAHPEMAIFIKYEFWFNFLAALKARRVRTFVISARFIANSRFFKWYGRPFRNSLKAFETIFVQDLNSVKLLSAIGVNNVMHAGDPRFDRVAQLASTPWKNDVVELFKNNDKLFVAGSTCGASDDDLMIDFINKHPHIRFVVVPHDLHPEPIRKYLNGVKGGAVLYTECNENSQIRNKQVLVYNTIGTLSLLYRYGNWAYIGGGFIAGVHSVIEATVYGIPCAFGPNYTKNRPCVELIAINACASVGGVDELTAWFAPLSADDDALAKCSNSVFNYTNENTGATNRIIQTVFRT